MGVLVTVLVIQASTITYAQDGGQTTNPTDTYQYGLDDPRLRENRTVTESTSAEVEVVSISVDPANEKETKESISKLVQEFLSFAEGGFETPKEFGGESKEKLHWKLVSTTYRGVLAAKNILTSSAGIVDFGYGARRFYNYKNETNPKLARALVMGYGISHGLETLVLPASMLLGNEVGMMVGAVIQIPFLDPLCRGMEFLVIYSPKTRSYLYRINLFIVKKFPGPLVKALGHELAYKFLYEKSKGEMFRELKEKYELKNGENVRISRTFNVAKSDIDFSFKNAEGSNYLKLNFSLNAKNQLLLKSIWFHPEVIKTMSKKDILTELRPFGGQMNNLMKQYVSAIFAGEGGVQNIVENDPAKVKHYFTTEPDGKKSLTLFLHNNIIDPISQNRSYFDWHFYSSEHAAIKHLTNVDRALVEKAQGEFLELIQKQLRKYPASTNDAFKMEKYIEYVLNRVSSSMNAETKTHFLGQVFRNGDVFLFAHENAYALKDDLRRSASYNAEAGEIEFKKIVALTQATFFNQLMNIKTVASYYHAAKALLSRFVLPDGTAVRDFASERFQNTTPSEALRRGYKFAIAFNRPHNSNNIHDNRMVEVDNWLTTQKNIPKYDFVLPSPEQIKGRNIAELITFLEKIPVGYIGVEGERYKAAVNEIDAQLKNLRSQADVKSQKIYSDTMRRLASIANKSMGTSVLDRPKNFSQQFLIEGGKFAIAILVSETIRMLSDPNVSLDDLVDNLPKEMARFATFAGSASIASLMAQKVEQSIYKKAGARLESQALEHLNKAAGGDRVFSRATAKKIVHQHISLIAGLVVNGILWNDGLSNPNFFKDTLLYTVPTLGAAQLIIKPSVSKAKSAVSAFRTGAKGFRVMAIETGPVGFLVAGVEMGLELTIAHYLEKGIRSKEQQTALEKTMRDYNRALSGEITGSRSKVSPEACAEFPVQSSAAIDCIGGHLNLEYMKYLQLETMDKVQATISDALEEEEEIIEDYAFIQKSLMGNAYVIDSNAWKKDKFKYADFRKMIGELRVENVSHLYTKKNQYGKLYSDIEPEILNDVRVVGDLIAKSEGVFDRCSTMEMDRLELCWNEGLRNRESYEFSMIHSFYKGAGIYLDESWYKRAFASLYDGTFLGLEFSGELTSSEIVKGIRSRGKSLIATTQAQKSRISDDNKFQEITQAVQKVLIDQMKLSVGMIEQIRDGNQGKEIEEFYQSFYTPTLTEVTVGHDVAPLPFFLPANAWESQQEYVSLEVGMIMSPIREVSVWVPRETKHQDGFYWTSPMSLKNEKVLLPLAAHLIQDVWSTMDLESFDKKYGAQLKQTEADLNDREKTKYLNVSGFKDILWKVTKGQHADETKVQRDKYLNAKLDLTLQLAMEMTEEQYPVPTSTNDGKCYEIQYYHETFGYDEHHKPIYDSAVTASGKPILHLGSNVQIPCSKIDELRSRIQQVMN